MSNSNVRALLVATATFHKCSVSEASTILQSEVIEAAQNYAEEAVVFNDACEAVISENPTIAKGDLHTFVAMRLAMGDMVRFASLLEPVKEYVNLTYAGKRGRRKEGDTSVRLTKRGSADASDE